MKQIIINTDSQFQHCIETNAIVEALFQGEVSYFGILETFTDATVMFQGGAYFLRENCEFRMALFLIND
ncbi:hypothetical protein GE107_21460 [Cohnella sp. CFH 77786]|uniref:hypothetical protein n=1 Tax=Cohnella sp. CFH 77786 TaxID=2662265 RepID=UPI001C60ADDA|nr:hypothetical protein [Cohnella sp. CFH 77786]MBW5448618.1 hypothetical protein [Cohnella sp. CFH 77786]